MPATSKIILGTVQFGLNYGINNINGKPKQAEVNDILDMAFNNKIRMLDTAEAYGDSQEVIGNYHLQSQNRFEVITKFGAKRNDLPQIISERVQKDLDLMKLNSLYAYMFHSFDDLKGHFDNFKSELLKLKQQGKIKRLGVSIYTNEEAEQVLSYSDIDLVQLPFNLLDNMNLRGAILKKMKERGIEIHTRSVFLQGLFFMKDVPAKLQELKPLLQHIDRIATQNKCTVNDLALNYALTQNLIDKVLIGVDTTTQLQENIDSMRRDTISISEIDQIEVKETTLLNPANWN